MLKKLAGISLTVGALVLAAPAVATAAPSDVVSLEAVSMEAAPYTEPPQVSVDALVDICEASSVVFGPGYFAPGENVAVGVSGENAANASFSGNVANGEGGLVLAFRPPANGNGMYSISFDGSRSYTAKVTVSHGHDSAVSCDHDPGVAAAGTELPLTGNGIELALTGGGVSPWAIGGGALALVAGGVLVAVGATRRKRA